MLKFIKYSILFILIANGSYPILVDHGLLEAIGVEVDTPQSEPDSNQDQQEEDDLAAPDKHVYKEPKPNDLEENEDLAGLNGEVNPILTNLQQEKVALTSATQPYISQGILRYVYYSKSSTLSSET